MALIPFPGFLPAAYSTNPAGRFFPAGKNAGLFPFSIRGGAW